MSPAPTSLENPIDALTGGSPTILPSATAARNLRQSYDAAQRSLGRNAWEPAPIFSWSQFLDSLWSEAIVTGIETRLLLNHAQEHSLWLDTVSAEATLASSDSLADLARHAWTLAHAYNATARLRAFAATPDARTFAGWAQTFQRDCDRNGYLSRAALESALQQHIATGSLPAPPTLTLAGFTDLTPAQTALLEALRAAGTAIAEHSLIAPQSPEAIHAVLAAPTEQDELRGIAHWLRIFLETRRQSGLTSRIAVLLPDSSDAPALEAVFRDVLAPELQSIAADLSSTPWEFASGPPLSSLPMISIALDLARWAQSPLALDQVGDLLLSPHLNPPAERDRNARFDAQVLRQAPLLRPEIDLPSFLRLAQASTLAPTWLKPLNRFLDRAGSLDTPRTFADWAEFLRSLLASANFPGPSTTSLEYHATEAWDSLLDRLSTLDFRGRRIPYSTFLQTLNRHAAETPFTPPSNNAPIQIMPPSAAAGITFDALILARATDANYPIPEHPNPLLSFTLQASLNMPGARQPRALDPLLSSAASILVTYATETPDGPQRLSPFLASLHYPRLEFPPPPPHPHIQEDLVEDTAPLPTLPSSHVQGGARVLQLQAACGFRAFAEMRLNAKELESASLGFDAAESGKLLHSALQHFWKVVETQKALRSMPSPERERILSQSIDYAMSLPSGQQGVWNEAYLALQKQRMSSLLQQWLDTELQRSPFTVLKSEYQQDIPVGPLTLDVRFDRIDKLEDDSGTTISNSFVLVDYKTGASGHPNQWYGPRPDDPQLPLYTLPYEPDELKALTFARVRAGEMKWLGYQAEPGILPASRINEVIELPTFIAEWRETLTQLAHDFADGRAIVDPKSYPKTCEHCFQRLVCRLDPTALATAEDTGEDPETFDE